jgi:cation:H+ antiporter
MSGDAAVAAPPGAHAEGVPSLRRAIITFAIGTVIVLVAAPEFAHAADAIATRSGLGTTFVGTWLVGFATSLPELVTCIAAVRLSAYDLAVGNLFGSNALNMTIFVVLDAVHVGSPILSVVHGEHVISALVAIVLMAVAVASLVYRARGWRHLREPSSAVLIGIYIVGLLLVLSAS